jgi:hypothetical protein
VVSKLGDAAAVNRAWVDGCDTSKSLADPVAVLLTGFDGGVVEVEWV